MKDNINDLFNLEDINSIDHLEPPKLTKDEFIDKTRDLINLILDKYNENWKNKEDNDNTEPCGACNGTAYREQGGDVVECPSCDGNGVIYEKTFDSESFSRSLEDDIMLGEDEKFFELLECKIIDNG